MFEIQHAGKLDGHRSQEEHGRHIVEERGQDGGHDAKDHDQSPHGATAVSIGLDGAPLEHPRMGEDAHHHHHAEEEPDRIPIHVGCDGADGRDVANQNGECPNRCDAPEGGGKGSMDHLGDDQGIDDQEDDHPGRNRPSG